MQRIRVLMGVLLAGVLIGIGGTVSGQQPDSIRYNEEFDPLKLNEPRPAFFEEESQQEADRQLQSDTTRQTGIQEGNTGSDIGYRVQLVATPNYHEADSLYSMVQDAFVENMDTTKAYLVYDSPNYKIRIGNCRTRDAAEQLLERAKEQGFRYAWIVRSSIRQSGENGSP